MKSAILTTLFAALLIYSSAQAQSATDIEALSSFLPAEKLASFQENDERLAEYAFINRHGYHLSNTGGKDFSSYPDLSSIVALYPNLPPITVELIENGELNLMGYNFIIKRDEYVYYRIAGNNQLLTIPPMNLSLQNFNSETE